MATNARVLSTYTGGGDRLDGGVSRRNFTPQSDLHAAARVVRPDDLRALEQRHGMPADSSPRAPIYIDLTPPPSPDPALHRRATGGEQAVIAHLARRRLARHHRPARLPDAVQPRRRAAGVLGRHVRARVPELPRDDERHRASRGWTRSSSARRCCRRRRDRFASRSCRTTSPTAWRSSRSIAAATPAPRTSSTATATKTKSFYDVYRNDDDPDQAGAATRRLLHAGGARERPRGALAGLGAALALGAIVIARRDGGGGDRTRARRADGAGRPSARRRSARAQTFGASRRARRSSTSSRRTTASRRPSASRSSCASAPTSPTSTASSTAPGIPTGTTSGRRQADDPDRVRLRDLPSLRHGRGRASASATSRRRRPRRSPAAPACPAATSRR